MLGLEPQVALPLTLETTPHAWAMIDDDGQCIGLFGVQGVDLHPYFGIVWMCSSPELLRYRRLLLTEAPKWLERLHDLYPLLGNHIDVRNTTHVRWLLRMGFSLLRVVPEIGVERRPFIEFAKLRDTPCAQSS
ncbi:MAG: hypothetical protein ACTHJ3_19615 [Pararhizobium sp.]